MGKNTIVNEYKGVFTRTELFSGDCSIHLKSDDVPVVDPPRHVPLPLQNSLKERQSVEQLGVINRVKELTNCVNVLVVVENPTIRAPFKLVNTNAKKMQVKKACYLMWDSICAKNMSIAQCPCQLSI